MGNEVRSEVYNVNCINRECMGITMTSERKRVIQTKLF